MVKVGGYRDNQDIMNFILNKTNIALTDLISSWQCWGPPPFNSGQIYSLIVRFIKTFQL